jgi:hypothetical protein
LHAWRLLQFRRYNAAAQRLSFLDVARRKKTMFARFVAFLRSFQMHPIREVQLAYLNGAANRVDLENRQRQVERGLFGHFDG